MKISIGDYSCKWCTSGSGRSDALVRLLRGFLVGKTTGNESFTTGLLDYPQYTRPTQFRDKSVPEVLLSGDHAAIEKWNISTLARTQRSDPIS